MICDWAWQKLLNRSRHITSAGHMQHLSADPAQKGGSTAWDVQLPESWLDGSVWRIAGCNPWQTLLNGSYPVEQNPLVTGSTF